MHAACFISDTTRNILDADLRPLLLMMQFSSIADVASAAL